MPFKEMLKPSPISRYTVIMNNFNHTLLWRLDTCIQTLWIHNFNLLVESLGSHARILTYLFRFNILLNAEHLNKFFSESQPLETVFDQNFTSASLWISAWFYRISQFFLLFVKGMKRLFHTSELCLVGKRCCSFGQGPLRFKAKTGCLAVLGCCGSPWHTLWHCHTQAVPKSLASRWVLLDAWLRETRGSLLLPAQSSLC